MIKNNFSPFLLWLSHAIDYPLIPPNSCSIGVTTRCNSRCAYCGQWNTIPERDHSTSTILNTISQLKSLGVKDLLLSGGEPMLRGDIFEIVKFAVSCNLQTRIITNGTMLNTETVKRLVDAGIFRIGVSVDTLDGELYQRDRGIKIDHLLRGLHVLEKVKAGDYPNLDVVLYTTITSQNLPDLISLVDYSHQVGFGNYFQPVQLGLGADEQILDNLWPNNAEIPLIKSITQKILERKAMGYRINNTEGYLRAIPLYFKQGTYKPNRCMTGYMRLTIDRDLGVRPCWMFAPVDYVSGNNLKAIWYSKAMSNKRREIRKKQCPGCTFNCHLDRSYTRF